MTEAGVIVRQLDALSKTGFAWEPCADHLWCAKYRHIWPSSIINKNHNRVMYRSSEAGLVLAPPPINRFNCVYPGDGNSMGHLGENNGCQQACQLPKVWDCSFAPEKLAQALEVNAGGAKYNEVVIDAQQMKHNLPGSIMAIFYMDERTKERAQEVHAEFVAHFGAAKTANFPLLRLSLTDGFSRG